MSCDLMLPRDIFIKCDYVWHGNSANTFLSLNSIKLYWSKARVVLEWLQGQTGKSNVDPTGPQCVFRDYICLLSLTVKGKQSTIEIVDSLLF